MTYPTLTTLNLYTLSGTAEAFTAAVQALAARVEREGHPGVLSYRFFVSEADGLGRAVVGYADSAAWIGHHDIAMHWPEMKALDAAAKLSDVTFLGDYSDDIRDWLAGSSLSAVLHTGLSAAAGFQRRG